MRETRCADWDSRNENARGLRCVRGGARRSGAGRRAGPAARLPAGFFRRLRGRVRRDDDVRGGARHSGDVRRRRRAGRVQDGAYVEISGSRFQKTGQRAFILNGQSFGLGIPLTATLTPIELSLGYRFKLKRHRTVIPYVAGGVGQYHYQETSSGSDPGEDLDVTHSGFLANTGVEFRLHKWVGVSVDAQYTHIPGIFGTGGLSKDAGESDLGGYSARVKVIDGR